MPSLLFDRSSHAKLLREDGVLARLGETELHDLLRLDLDRLAGRGIAFSSCFAPLTARSRSFSYTATACFFVMPAASASATMIPLLVVGTISFFAM